jgi:trans-aconitate 2-methyltransferase
MLCKNWNANDYAQHSSAQFKWAMELIDKIILNGDESLLDMGCGDGKITAFLSEKCRYVVGSDVLDFKCMDVLELSCHEEFKGFFDVIFSNSVLHWIKDHQRVLRGMYSALKPSGKCFLRFGGKGTLAVFQPIIDRMIKNDRWSEYFSQFTDMWWFYDSDTYIQWVKDSGLTPISVQCVSSKMSYPDRRGLEGWMDLFVSEFVDRFLKQYLVDSDGEIGVDMVRLEVIDKKELASGEV